MNQKIILGIIISVIILISAISLSFYSLYLEEDDKTNLTQNLSGLIKVTDDIYSFGSNGYFSLIMITDEGIIIVDPVNQQHSENMLDAIKEISDKPIKYLIYSHNHWDHIAGGKVFEDTTVLSHEDAHDWLVENPNSNVRTVDETWKGNTTTITLGGDVLELYQFGKSHGKGMTVFYIPQEKIVFLVDILTPHRLPFTIMPDFTPKGWENTLMQVEELDYDITMYGHKNATGTPQEVTEIREYLQDLRAEIILMMNDGVNPMDIPSTIQLEKYEDFEFYDEWLEMNTWRVMLEMGMGW